MLEFLRNVISTYYFNLTFYVRGFNIAVIMQTTGYHQDLLLLPKTAGLSLRSLAYKSSHEAPLRRHEKGAENGNWTVPATLGV